MHEVPAAVAAVQRAVIIVLSDKQDTGRNRFMYRGADTDIQGDTIN